MAREYRYSIKGNEHYFHRLDLTRVALERLEALVDETQRVADATERVAERLKPVGESLESIAGSLVYFTQVAFVRETIAARNRRGKE